MTQTPDDDPIEFRDAVHKRWLADWLYFNTDSMMTDSDLNEPFRGLALPTVVVEKIYRINARREFVNAWVKIASK
jgi:hypothetical protein